MNAAEKAFWETWERTADARPSELRPAQAQLFFNAGIVAQQRLQISGLEEIASKAKQLVQCLSPAEE